MNRGVIILLSCVINFSVFSQDYKFINSLEGKWKFSVGDQQQWSNPEYDDSSWEEIFVPSAWEMQGFNGYNGYAWYRKSIHIGNDLQDESLVLQLGYIDDVDEVFFNGVRIGSSGVFPPDFSTAYNSHRFYAIPDKLIRYNSENVIAIRVYDDQMEGGINRGDVRLVAERVALKTFYDLQGEWDFKTGDSFSWRFYSEKDNSWDKIYVPGAWENQGYKCYDGFAWYQKTFLTTEEFEKDRIVLLLGKIDDVDEVYINGVKIGQTGFIEAENASYIYTQAYKELRGYLIPEGILYKGKSNVIHVRVLDFTLEGGIIEGPVGFITQTRYISYWNALKKENRR